MSPLAPARRPGRHRRPGSAFSRAISPGTRHALPRAAAVGMLATGLLLSGTTLAEAAPVSSRPVATVTKPTLGYGSRGADVSWVQKKLDVTPRSGYFGPKTQAAVKRFQKQHGLAQSGRVDVATWRAMGVAASPARAASADARASRSSVRTALPAQAKVLSAAARQKGVRYRWGGTSPKTGFDCSGFVGYVFRQLGISLPRSAAAIRQAVPRIPASKVRPGDLVFVHKHGRVSHVAIYAGGGMWWEATRPGKPLGLHKAWSKSVSYGRVLS